MYDPNDPIERALTQYEIDQERQERMRPVCDNCGEPLGDSYWNIERWEKWCEACVDDWVEDHRYSTEELE